MHAAIAASRFSGVIYWEYGLRLRPLETRCSALKLAGLSVCDTVGPRSFRQTPDFLASPHDLWVICHSVPEDERELIANIAANRERPVLQIQGFILPDKLMLEVILRLAQQPKVAA